MLPISTYIKRPSLLGLALLRVLGSSVLPDKLYLKWRYRLEMGRGLDLQNPKTLNEKLQWLKLYYRKPEYTTMVDKYAVKQYVAGLIGEQYVIPTLGVWERPEDIDFDALPNQFVLKTTHGGGGGGVVICKDKSTFDKAAAIKKLKTAYKSDIYKNLKEWPYKNVKKQIIAEQYLSDGGNHALVDYKFYCFHGVADVVLLCTERDTGHTKFYFFDRNWELKRYNKQGKAAPEGFTLPKPAGMDEMFDIAEALSRDLPFARVDLYSVEGHIYFGEITFYPASGFDTGRLPETDLYFGTKLNLPTEKVM